MNIFWSGNNKDIVANDSSYRLRQIMGSNEVNLNFSLSEYVEFPLGCKINFQGQEYTMNTPQSITEINSKNFEYSLVFGSKQDLLSNFKMRDVEGRLKFPFTAKPSEHIQLLVNVLNKNDSGWSVGDCIDKSEKLISYNHTNCLDAISTISNEFETEFDVVDKTINLRKISNELDAPLALSYGKGNGFISGVGRKNDSQKSGFNVLFVQGGDRNIDFSKYGNKELLLPKNAAYTYKGFNYKTDSLGLSITCNEIPTTNIKEESLDLSHIYPQRVGTISDVILVNYDKNFYDFIDNSIPADLDFSQLVTNGEKITIRFESGRLSGREFEIIQNENVVSGYVHAERRFKLVPKEDDGYIMPSGVFVPAIGDKYAVFGMMFPAPYISDNSTKTGASWEMFKEAAKHFYENQDSKFTFKGELDGIWAKNDWLNIGSKLKVGNYILFSDTQFQPAGITIRITSIKDYINNPYSPIIELANSVQGGSITNDLDKIKENEVVVQSLYKQSLDFTKRAFRDSKETIKLLEAAQLNFSSAINPVAVETMALLVGDKSLQFRFVNGFFAPINHLIVFNQSTKILTAEEGTIQHLTLEIDSVKPNQTLKTWTVAGYTSTPLIETEQSYYLYIKASKSNTVGVFVLSPIAIKLEQVAGYYHLLTAIINTEFENGRSIVKMYGFTEILPGQIKVDKLSSGNGTQTIELLQDQIKINAKVTFTNDSPALNQVAVQQAPKLAEAQLNAETSAKSYAYSQDVLKETTTKAYADGKVTAEETRAIADAQARMNEAKAYSVAQDNAISIGGRNYVKNSTLFRAGAAPAGITPSINGLGELVVNVTDGNNNYHTNFWTAAPLVTTEFKSGENIVVSMTIKRNSGTGNNPSIYLYDGIPYTSFIGNITTEFSTVYCKFTVNSNSINPHLGWAGTSGIFTIKNWKIEKGTKATDWTPAPEDVQAEIAQSKIDAEVAAKAYADAQDVLKETTTKAYADGKVTAEETRAIADAQAKANAAEAAAKAFATAQDNAISIGGRNYIRDSNRYINTPNSSFIYNIESLLELKAKIITLSLDVEFVNASGNRIGIEPAIQFIDGSTQYLDLWIYPNDYGGNFKGRITKTFQIENKTISHLAQRGVYIQMTGSILKAGRPKLEFGTKATDWSPAPEDTEAEIATAKAESANALSVATSAQNKTNFLQTAIDGNVVNTGMLQVGSVTGANAGISGIVDQPSNQSVRFWAGANYAGKETAPWVKRENGVEEEWLNGVLIRRKGIIGGSYLDELYNTNGQIAKRTKIVEGKIVEEWFYNGALVYQIGQGGIYYVSEIPESFTLHVLVNLTSTAVIDQDYSPLHNKIRSFMYKKSGESDRYQLVGNTNAYLYSSGVNVYSESNKQYEGYKKSASKTDHLANGWYAMQQLVDMTTYFNDVTIKRVDVLLVINGKVVNSGTTSVDTTGYSFPSF